MCKVLWIDDEYKKQDTVISDAELSGINIIPFESHEEGINYLEANLDSIDAIILDAKVKDNKDDETTNLEGLRKSRDYINSLPIKIRPPYFIFTGQPDYMESDMFIESYGDPYIKATDNEKLFADIKAAVIDRPNAKIRALHPKVFELFKNGFIDKEYEKHLLKILATINSDDLTFDDELYFNQLRQMLEVAMRRANEAGLLHDKCINDKGEVILQLSSIFLSGKYVKAIDVKCNKNHFPEIISNHVREILDITNIGSHADKDEKNDSEANLKEYRKMLNTPYLLYALTFKLMDVLLWFSEYIKENNNIELNKSLWVDTSTPTETIVSVEQNWIEGTVTRIAENGWGTFIPNGSTESISIPPNMVRDHSIEEFQKIDVVTKPSPDGTKTHIESIRI